MTDRIRVILALPFYWLGYAALAISSKLWIPECDWWDEMSLPDLLPAFDEPEADDAE